MQYQNDDRLVMDDTGVQLFGPYTLNGNNVATQVEIDALHTRINGLDSDIQEINQLLQDLLQFRQ
jgi:t-SNARE complex subunit (syntaxin)